MKRLEADINKTEEEMNKPPPKTEDSTVLKAEEVRVCYSCCMRMY